MQEMVFALRISADEYLKQYRTPGAVVVTRSRDGRRVRFPANILQPFVTHSGVSGTFVIRFNDQNRFESIERLG